MEVIRKVWIGSSVKGDGTMSWEVGQTVTLGRLGRAVVDHIKKDEEGVHIFVKKDNMVFPWKSSSLVAAIEYDVNY